MLFSFVRKTGGAMLLAAACAWGAQGGPKIMAHLSSDGVSATQLSLRNIRGRDYLYIRDGAGTYTVIDVTRPARPQVAPRLTSNANTNMQALGSTIGVIDASNPPLTAAQAAGGSAPHNMRFVDTSNPSNPKPIAELNGATSMATDRFRGLLFVSNSAGLWVVYDESLIDPSVKAWLDFTSAP